MLFPVTEVPPQLILVFYVNSTHVQFMDYLSKAIQALSFHQFFPYVNVTAQSYVQHLKEMASDARIISSWIYFSHLQILKGQSIYINDLAVEKSRILQQGLSTHYSINMRLSQTLVNIWKSVDSSISKDGNVYCLLYFSDDVPVSTSHSVFILLFSPAMNCQKFAASLLYSLDQFQCLLF